MNWARCMRYMILNVLVLLTLSSGTASALSDIESRRIEYLISSLENLSGAKFVRNGSEHDAKAAAAHLRMKLKRAGSRVKTAGDFIEGCASKSSFSGEPYLIVFSNGQTMPAGEYFRNKLKEYNLRVK